MLYRPTKRLTRPTKIACLISLLCLSVSSFAVDSTAVLNVTGSQNKGKPAMTSQYQVDMVDGWTSLRTNYADYSSKPGSISDLPKRPNTCLDTEQIVNYNYGPASTVNSVCTSYSCDTSCSWYDVGCWGEVTACEACVTGCSIVQASCNCPKMQCSRNDFVWSGSFNGPEILTSVTCGIKGRIPKSKAQDQANQIAQAKAAGKQVAVNQINGVFNTLQAAMQVATGFNIGSISGTVANGLAAATSYITDLANQAASAFEDVGNSIADAFSSW